MGEGGQRRKRVALFGNFGSSNFGNEASLQAMLFHLRRARPDAELICICTNPGAAAAIHHIRAVPIAKPHLQDWLPKSASGRLLRKLSRACLAIAGEPYAWLRGFMTLRSTEMLLVPGTGLLTDAHGLLGAGPYNLLKWTLIAKARRCRVVFVSVGAGPLDRALGSRLVKLALGLAGARSYRDASTKRCLQTIGFRADDDRVYPDLAFSLPEASLPGSYSNGGRPVVGLGLMEAPGRYGDGTSNETHRAYLGALVAFAAWLVEHGYDVRVLVGDHSTDLQAKQQFRELVRQRAPVAARHVIDDSASSVDELLSQIARTKLVVATRFHGVLLSFVCGKPAICISFHEKCADLMRAMRMSEYCLEMNKVTADELIETFRRLERAAPRLAPLIRERAAAFRSALADQYERIFDGLTVAAPGRREDDSSRRAVSTSGVHGGAADTAAGGF
jgi:polysaccharide pyruvyl transferase WcaK-like protein